MTLDRRGCLGVSARAGAACTLTAVLGERGRATSGVSVTDVFLLVLRILHILQQNGEPCSAQESCPWIRRSNDAFLIRPTPPGVELGEFVARLPDLHPQAAEVRIAPRVEWIEALDVIDRRAARIDAQQLMPVVSERAGHVWPEAVVVRGGPQLPLATGRLPPLLGSA